MVALDGDLGKPAADPVAVGFVLVAEGAAKSGLLVAEDEERGGEEKDGGVSEERERAIEERGPGEREGCAEVHGIADEPVGAANDEVAWRVEGRGSPFAVGDEA